MIKKFVKLSLVNSHFIGVRSFASSKIKTWTEFDPSDSDLVRSDYENFISSKTASFVLSYCPHCHATLETLKNLDIEANVLQVDTLPNADKVKQFLNTKTGMRTFPKNFVNGQFVGGNDDF